MIDEITETEILVLREIAKGVCDSQQNIAKRLNLPESTLSRAINYLEEANLITCQKVGKFKECHINRNKVKEILEIVAIWEEWNQAIKDKRKIILRVHDYEIYCHAFISRDFHKEKYNKFEPKNRVCRLREFKEATVNIDFKYIENGTNPIQIFIVPFYLVVPADINEVSLSQLIDGELTKKYFLVREYLKAEGVHCGGVYEIRDGSIAIADDWLARLAIRYGIKNNNIDESHYCIPEWEEHGEEAVKRIKVIIEFRKLFLDYDISEFELQKIKDKIIKEIEKLKQNGQKINTSAGD